MNKKKLLTLAMALSMVAILAIGGTIAYFTEAEQQTNVFSVAGLEIDLKEDVDHKAEDGTQKTAPIENLGDGENGRNTGYTYVDIMPGDEMKKIVTVENEEKYPVYVTLAIKNNNYLNFNQKIDDYYEAKTVEELNAMGIEGTTKDDAMQKITDSIWSGKGWGLSYTKSDAHPLRYEMVNNPQSENEGMVLGRGYANSTQTAQGVRVTNYHGAFFPTAERKEGDLEGNFDSINTDHTRMWVIYLQIPGNDSFTIDLSTTCPAFITTDTIDAFDAMELEIQAAAIQVDGFATPEAAFAELHETWNFGY